MKKSLLGGLVLSLTMGGAAMAADMAVKARPYAPAFSWAGKPPANDLPTPPLPRPYVMIPS